MGNSERDRREREERERREKYEREEAGRLWIRVKEIEKIKEEASRRRAFSKIKE